MPDFLDNRGTKVSVCFVGLGRMGVPLVSRLLDAGYPVAGFDRYEAAGAELNDRPGFVRATSLEAAADGAQVIVLIVPDSDAVEEVVVDGHLLAAPREGTIILDMSSSEPLRTRRLARRVAQAGAHLIDAPVSGGVRGAREGTLSVMVGGPPEIVAEVEPLLATLGSSVTRVGDVGAGHALKALNNLMSATHLLATSEAMLAAERFGLDPAIALDVVNGSSGRSGSTENKWPNFILTGDYDSGFSLKLMLKDMRIALDLENQLDVPSPLAERAVAIWEQADRQLPDGVDHTEIARWLGERSELKKSVTR